MASARAPLQAKIEDMEDAMQHLQDKFDKVKAENDRVRFFGLVEKHVGIHRLSNTDYVSETKRQ